MTSPISRRLRAHTLKACPIARRSNLYFRIRAMLHPLYWRCQSPRRLLVTEVTEGSSHFARVDVLGHQGRRALEGPGCRFTFDALTGRLLSAERLDWKGF